MPERKDSSTPFPVLSLWREANGSAFVQHVCSETVAAPWQLIVPRHHEWTVARHVSVWFFQGEQPLCIYYLVSKCAPLSSSSKLIAMYMGFPSSCSWLWVVNSERSVFTNHVYFTIDPELQLPQLPLHLMMHFSFCRKCIQFLQRYSHSRPDFSHRLCKHVLWNMSAEPVSQAMFCILSSHNAS